MTQDEKRFKIKQKISYEEQLNKEKKNADKSLFWTGFCALMGVMSLASINHPSNGQIEQTIFTLATITHGGVSVYCVKELIKSICKKTLLQDKIKDISSELKLDDNEQKGKGMR